MCQAARDDQSNRRNVFVSSRGAHYDALPALLVSTRARWRCSARLESRDGDGRCGDRVVRGWVDRDARLVVTKRRRDGFRECEENIALDSPSLSAVCLTFGATATTRHISLARTAVARRRTRPPRGGARQTSRLDRRRRRGVSSSASSQAAPVPALLYERDKPCPPRWSSMRVPRWRTRP